MVVKCDCDCRFVSVLVNNYVDEFSIFRSVECHALLNTEFVTYATRDANVDLLGNT
jgi:hypothetical protein